jgi:hypothetical protein|tara:strand:+ start:289 stop:630 length:342 start_codon:yes stop_codon:yes gene_type:complete
MKTFSVDPYGYKFATVCRTDGYWSITWLSKNKKAAARKGDEFVSGKRTAMRKYTTAYGRAINEEKSRRPKRVGLIAHTPHGGSSVALALAVAATMPADLVIDVLIGKEPRSTD